MKYEISIRLDYDGVKKACERLGLQYTEVIALGFPYCTIYDGSLIGKGWGDDSPARFTFYDPGTLTDLLDEMGVRKFEAEIRTDTKVKSREELEDLINR